MWKRTTIPSPCSASRTLALMDLLGQPARNGELIPKPQDQIDKMELDAINHALDDHKRVAFIIHGNNFSDLVHDNGHLVAKLLTSWDDMPPLPRMAAGILTRWNNGQFVRLPPENQHGQPWRISKSRANQCVRSVRKVGNPYRISRRLLAWSPRRIPPCIRAATSLVCPADAGIHLVNQSCRRVAARRGGGIDQRAWRRDRHRAGAHAVSRHADPGFHRGQHRFRDRRLQRRDRSISKTASPMSASPCSWNCPPPRLFGAAVLARWINDQWLEILFGATLLLSLVPIMAHIGEELPAGIENDRLASWLRLNSFYYDKRLGRRVDYQVTGIPLPGVMFVAGVVSGLLGIGAGVLKVLAHEIFMKVPTKVSTATSNFMIGVTAAAAAGVYLREGKVLPFVVVPVATAVLAGAFVGTKLMEKMSNARIRQVFAVALGIIGIQMLLRGLGVHL